MLKQYIKDTYLQYAPGATIFMLHRVAGLDPEGISVNEHLKISPRKLEEVLTTLSNRGYTYISIDELHRRLEVGESVHRCVVFTLDDGYKDNYTAALPIFKRHNVPFTVYVSTSFPDRTALLWWDALAEHLKVQTELTPAEREHAFLRLRAHILQLPQDELAAGLEHMFPNNDIDWYAPVKSLALNWDEVRVLAEEPLVTIGSHTVYHYALNQLSDTALRREVLGGIERLTAHIELPVTHFAYPFGDAATTDERVMQVVASMSNIKTAVTTRFGKVTAAHKEALSQLPRIMLTESICL